MSIRQPTPALSTSDKELLALLSRLLIEQLDDGGPMSNKAPDRVTLSDAEARRLFRLLTQLTSTREFLENSHFVEGITLPQAQSNKALREIYFAGRKRHGKSRAASSMKWADFEGRFGWVPLAWRVAANPMSFEHFLDMERKLFESAELTKPVVDLLMSFIDSQRAYVELAREGKQPLVSGSIRRLMLDGLQSAERLSSSLADMPTSKVAGIATVVANMSVIFSTRDWGVAGTLSTIAGAGIAAGAP